MRYIIIVNFNSSDVLADCIASIVHEDAHVVVVENGSTQVGEYDRCLSLLSPLSRHTLVRSESNMGFGAGVNLGIAQAAPEAEDLIWILNPDTVVPPGTYARLQRSMFDLGACIVSPTIVSGNEGESVWFSGGVLNRKRGETRHLTARSTDSLSPSESSFLTGAAIMLRGDVWHRLGGFREDLFLYWEDADLSIRATASGIKMFVIPGVEIWHYVGASSGRSGKSATWYYFMSRNRLVVCANGLGSCLSVLCIAGFVPTARLFYRAFRESTGRWEKLRALLSGTWSGIRLCVRSTTTPPRLPLG